MIPNPHQRIKQLIQQLRQYNYHYFVLDDPLVSDAVYDQLWQELQTLERQYPDEIHANSPTQRVGSGASDVEIGKHTKITQFNKILHQSPMLSLNNGFVDADIESFYQQAWQASQSQTIEQTLPQHFDICCELKMDGLALSLWYKNHALVYAATRGDGTQGEDITHHAPNIAGILLHLPADAPTELEVRGEVVIPKKIFAELNQALAEQDARLFANPRNAAAGSLRQLDAGKSANRGLHFFAYSAQINHAHTQAQTLACLEDWGYYVSPYYTCVADVAGMQDFFTRMQNKRASLAFDVDGVVYKVNQKNIQQILGQTARAPRWGLAQKFPAEEALAQILAIDIQVGRTGALTPVARLTPTHVGGVTIRNATLHNIQEIQRKNIGVGDFVYIRRAADVIPEIYALAQKAEHSQAFNMPAQCPSCHTDLDWQVDDIVIRCPSAHCPAKLLGQLKHFVARRAMNIDGLGEKILQQLLDQHYISGLADIFTLHEKKAALANLPKMGEKSVDNLLQAIESARQTTWARLLFAMGVMHVGEQTAKDIAAHFPDLMALKEAQVEDFLAVPDVGPVVAQSLHDYIHSAEIKALERVLLHVIMPTPLDAVNHEAVSTMIHPFWDKKHVVITGAFAQPREVLAEILTHAGAIMQNQISQKTDILVVGEKAGSKLSKAQSLGVHVMHAKDLKTFAMFAKHL